MTMHVVLGDGGMTRRELTETLADLWAKDEASSQSFWFLIQGKSEPTDTDKTLVTWLEKNEIYYELVTDDPDSVSEIYSAPQEVHTAKKISQKVVGLLQSKPEEGEPAEILALFYDVNDATAAEDRWLNQVIQAAFDAGFVTRALNDGLVEIDLSTPAEETPSEEKPSNVTPIKSIAKKTVAKIASRPAPATTPEADTPVPAEDDTAPAPPSSTKIPTRSELEDMEPSEVKEVANSMGIVLPPRTRATTYIEHILGEAKPAAPAPAAEVQEVAEVSLNGDVDYDALANTIADLLWEKIQKALSSR